MGRPTSHFRCAALAAALLSSAPALAQWSSDPLANTPVVAAAAEQAIPLCAAAPDGAVWFTWFSNASGNYDLYAQRLDAAGLPTFPAPGLLISAHPQNSALFGYHMIADSAGNLAVVFSDQRNGASLDVFAYRISPAGDFLWGPDGVELSSDTAFEPDPRIVESGGDFFIIWARTDLPDRGIILQRLSPAGQKQLGASGVIAVSGAVEGPSFVEAVAAEPGTIVAVYLRDTRSFPSPRHLYAQKFDSAGAPQWAGAGTNGAVIVNDATVLPIAHHPRLLPDGAGGAVVAWHDSRTSSSNCFVQRLDSSGAPLFADDGLAVSNLSPRQRYDPAIGFDPAAGDTYIFWNERNTGQSQHGLSAQLITDEGALAWGPAGAELLPLAAAPISFISARFYSGAATVAYQRQTNFPAIGEDVSAFRMNAAAAQLWSPAPLLLSAVASDKLRGPLTATPAGLAVYAWEDHRAGPSDVYAQSVNLDGSLGPPPPPPCPGDFNGDGVRDTADFFEFFAGFFASPPSADYNGDGATNTSDFFEFFADFFGPPC